MNPAPPVIRMRALVFIMALIHQSPAREFALHLADSVWRLLPFEPGGEIFETCIQLHGRSVTQQLPSKRDIGIAVTNISDTVVSPDFGLKILFNSAGDAHSIFPNCVRGA